ncbi:FAD:protein FMN transferase [Simiduia sp. 21SJ11W-1]|uniref:FAD:protein FMN transferase n=1 Tax=Simiduia sp. 21SJ11W-1 TaxID=2909669 RepID=UPI00209D03A4|nr:FAD:protein FMN transferase [Simiduia sp. 21SJ11W-1]UTA47875.1 FAD:protein FMN transferase [Simiduia sp. 21SJ11W-1]
MRVRAKAVRWLALILCLPCLTQAEWHYERAAIMGTEITVYLWHEQPAEARLAALEVLAEMRRIDQWLSPWIESSELSKLNAEAARAPVAVTPELMQLLAKSLYYGQLSDGAFDITFASVGFKYDYRAGIQPDEKERKRLLPAVNYQSIALDQKAGTVAFKHPDLRIDLGGIAKGYAVDRAIDLLRARGIAHASVSAGGDSRMLGDKRGRPWIVGVKNPRQEDALALRLPLADVALSTSGDYERYFIDEQGRRVHHIINPRTGESSEGVMSVTVMGPKGFDTDPLSTTVFVLGVARGLALIERLPQYDAIVIDAAGKVHFSSGLQPPDGK